jgi:hypothetical protein
VNLAARRDGRLSARLRREPMVDELIGQTRELLAEIRISFDDPERYFSARSEWKRKSDRLNAILPAETEPLD